MMASPSRSRGRRASLLRDLLNKRICHVFHPGAHRTPYKDLMMGIFDMEGMVGALRKRNLVDAVLARQMLFATIDGNYRDFLIVSWLRTLRGRSTVGLFVGSTAMLRSGDSSRRTKRLIQALRLSAELSKVDIFTIIPHHICPELEAFRCDWIHDPQMWDLLVDEDTVALPSTPLSDQVQQQRGERPVVIFVGKGSKTKGFPELVRFARAHQREVLIVTGGVVQEECAEAGAELKALGMIVENRYLTDDEVLSLYGVADFAWCYYSGRDQASGIFGRAVQTGVVPLVKRGSFLAVYAEWYGLRSLVLDLGADGGGLSTADLRHRNTGVSPERRRTLEEMRDVSLGKLSEALAR